MDELMTDWLYDELDAPRSAHVSEHLESCARCSAQMGALRSTRAILRELPQVEPPSAISAILVHEAARRAPAGAAPGGATESRGFWHRLRAAFKPLVLHPAATAIASLILVAGVAGALYVRSSWDIGDPHAIPEQEPMRPEATTAGDAPAGPSETRAPQGMAEPSQESAAESSRADGVAAQLLEGEEEADLRAATVAKPDVERKRRVEAKRKQTLADQPRDEPARSAVGRGSARASAAESGDQAAAPSTVSGAGPAAPPPAQDKDVEDDESDSTTPSKKEQGWLQVQEQRLTALARKKRCREAAAVANDILDRNPDYFARRVRVAKEVELCRSDIGNEQRRRAAARQAQPPQGGAGAPPQSKAAPEKNEAAESGQ
jgi:hypothetical protein